MADRMAQLRSLLRMSKGIAYNARVFLGALQRGSGT
jgi:hypothetical protein